MQSPNRFLAHALVLTLIGSLFSIVLPTFQTSHASHENITVNIGIDDVTKVYEPDDDVSIEGVIDREVDGEDVIIEVYKPSGGSPADTERMEPGSGGVFDHIFSIPGNAAGGIWTVKVEYDDEETFTYFMVEYDNDAPVITVVLDQDEGIYEANDEVTISGAVDSVESGEDFVDIRVLDPANDEIVDTDDDEVELGQGSGVDDDEFEFSFDLDNDASHGRYAVLVTYADNQEGAILFEIEDEGEGSGGDSSGDFSGDEDSEGDLAAQIEQDTYEPGDNVAIEGTIDGYDSDDNEALEIVVQDPDDEEVDDYGDDNADVDDNGDFTYDFDLNDDANPGTYTVIISYIGDEVQLTFEVEDSASGSSDDDDVDVTSGITDGDVTAKLNKASYLAGESMTVSGTVAKLKVDDDDNPLEVSILLYRPSGAVILAASKYVEPSSSRTFSAQVVLPSNLESDVDYMVIVSYDDDSVELVFDITGVSSNPVDELTVVTDKDEYKVGDTVEISGKVPEVISGQQLLIRVNKPDGNPCRIDPISIPASGSYTYELVLGGICSVGGEYDVEVTYGNKEADTSFVLVGEAEPTQPEASKYDLSVDSKTYPIEFEISGGQVNSMFVRQNEDKLVINMESEENGQLKLALPRQVIDAVDNGTDIEYVVTIEDEAGNISVVEVDESENTDNERTLVIDYPAGTSRIEITGTQVVPEFGAIAAIIMAIAIVGMIVATAGYNKLFRQ